MVPDGCEAVLEAKDISLIEEKLNKFVEETKYPLSIKKDGTNIKIIAKGISAHGSTPEKGENAISYLMAFLGELLDASCDICEFINMYNERIGFKHHGEGIGCGFEDDVSGKLNFNPGVIKGNEEEIKLTINVRYPIKSSAKEVYDGIREALKDTGIELIEGDSDNKPLYIPKDNFF